MGIAQGEFTDEQTQVEERNKAVWRRWVDIADRFPDARTKVHEVLADGEYVSTRFTVSGTHLGPLMGFAPTGKRFELDLIEIARFRDGKIVERWTERDFLKLLQQLGLGPAA